jgi:hypothetical protein
VRLTRRPLVFAAVAIGAALVALGPIADGDIYWHLAAGAEMWRRGALLRFDPFTISAGGRAWVDVHWLFQLAAAGIHHAFGFAGLAAAKALIVAAGAALLTWTAERGGGAVARDLCACALLLLLFFARHLIPIRPILVTLLLLATFLLALESARRGGSRRGLVALPLLQVVWVNCQGLAPLGPALVGCYAVGVAIAGGAERRLLRPLALALAGCVLASFATPFGLAALRLPGELLARITPGHHNVFSTAIAENVPPFVLDRTSPEATSHLRLVLAVLAASLALVRPRLHPAHALALAGFGALALMANRNVLLFYWLLAPLAAIALGPAAAARLAAVRARPWLALPRGRALGATLLLVLAGELGLGAVALAREPRVTAPTPFHFPTESARLLAARGAAGSVFAPDQHGGFLTFSVPALHPYIDTCLILHTAREYEDYLAVFDDPARFDELDARERFGYVVLTTAYPDRYLPLVAHLAASPDWKLLYTDGSEVLFGREGTPVALQDRATLDGLAAALDRRYADLPEARATARLHLARLLVVVGQPPGALRVLEGVDSRAAAELRARCHFAAGDLAGAEALARLLLHDRSDDVRSLTLLAEAALARAAAEDARRYLGQALAADPYDPEARAVLARLEQKGNPSLGAP